MTIYDPAIAWRTVPLRSICCAIVTVLAAFLVTTPSAAHSGNTDSTGGHYNRTVSPIEYHYHATPTSPPSSTPPIAAPPTAAVPSPISQTVAVGSSLDLSISPGGSLPLTYQWRKDGLVISGATSNEYFIFSVSSSSAGAYTCTVSNSYGSTTATVAIVTVTVLTPPSESVPSITIHPRSQAVTQGSQASFAVSATGASPLTYQWYLNDNLIVGATSATFNIPSVNTLNTGTYHVVVRNAQGQVTSQRATLTIGLSAPSIAGQPQGGSIAIGSSTILAVAAIGIDMRYQWFLNDTPILGATHSTYPIDRAQTWMAGSYKVRATNAAGVATSNPASLVIGTATFADDFSGANIDSNLWITASPFSDSRTDLASGSLTLRNRGRLLSKTALPTAFNITTRFRFVGSSFDQYAIFFRTNGSTGNGSFNSGVGAYFQIRSGDQGSTGVNNIKIAQNDGDATGSFPISLNTWYDASVDDNGSQVVIKINGTEVVRRNTSTRTGNLIGIQNREGSGGGSSISAGSAVEVDYVRITSPSTASDAILPAPRLANISTRGFVGTGAEAIVIGFVTSGSRSQRLLVRAAGPALSDFGIQGALDDPLLKIFASGGVTIAANDNWNSGDGAVAQTVGAFAFAPGSRDAALSAAFAPGAYTIEITGANEATGTALVEAYDLDSSDQQVRLANISTRGKVTGSDPLIAGLVVSGTTPRRVLIRGIGPTLTSFGLGAALADPVLTVFDPNGNMLIENDDWGTQETATAVQAASSKAGAFALVNNSKDAAVLAYLPPAAYTFVVNTKTGSPGIALIEVYDLD